MKKSSILMMLMALFMSVTSFAQGIKGTVIDENGEPVIGATVAEKSNAKNATITDFDTGYHGNLHRLSDIRRCRQERHDYQPETRQQGSR